jgi:hypothetical protein
MADDNHNDDQAAKLIESLSGKMVEQILPKIQASVEAQLEGLKTKNAELLDELKQAKAGPSEVDKVRKLLDGLDGKAAKEDDLAGYYKKGQPVRITKADARDVRKYREARKMAADRGVQLEINRD